MGRFGISFSDDPHYLTVMRNRLKAMEMAEGLEVGAPDETPALESGDGPFQRTLAWSSYFVLVFVAMCVFNQPAMADALESTTGLITHPGQMILSPVDQWALRGTN
jgi:hypothetical protein